MKTFQPSPELLAFYNAVVAKANYADAFSENATAAHRTLPPVPARPTDVQQAAFLDHLCMPLYGLVKNAYDRMNAVVAQQMADPYGVNPSTGQPYHPEMWGTQSGAP
jgi:hypothetical protein